MGTETDRFHFYKPADHEGLVGPSYTTALNNNWDELEKQFEGSPFDIRTEGAACDGVTDDWGAIMATLEKTRYYAIGAGFGGATMPTALQGSAGGGIYIPYGVTCISDTIAPDQRGGTVAGQSAGKTFSVIGPGYGSCQLKAIGSGWSGKPMLELGGDGAGNNSNNSDNNGAVVRGIRFEGATLAATGVHLIECSTMVVEDNAFGSLTDYGVLSDNDPASGHDYGSIDLTIQRNFFGWRGQIGGVGLPNGIGVNCKDSHSLTVQGNEFSNCRHGNLKIWGGGGNNHRVRDNSFEGMGAEAQTDAGGPYHSLYLNTSQGTTVEGNAWEDSFSQAVTPDCRPVYIAGAGDYTLIANTFYCSGEYTIEVAGGLSSFDGLHLWHNHDYSGGRTATVKIPADPIGTYVNLFALGNTNFLYEDPNGRMVIGPHTGHRGFTKMSVGPYDPVGDPHDIPIDGTTLEVRGSMWLNSFLEGTEIADPAAPNANRGKLYFRDNGSGKTQLCVLFSSGAAQVIATEP